MTAHPPVPRYPELDLSALQLQPIATREHKVRAADFVDVKSLDRAAGAFLWDALPDQFAGIDLRDTARHLVDCLAHGWPVVLTTGAHVVKVGVSPYLIDWIQRGVLSVIGVNGAFLVHDVEIATYGETSEWVGKTIVDGRFGMAQETGAILNDAFNTGVPAGLGLGESIGYALASGAVPTPFGHLSVLRAAYEAGMPFTVHLALGTDVYHYYPTADGAILGAGTMRDFRIFAKVLTQLTEGGLLWNLGSAVIMPVVIEKALAVAQNLGHKPGPIWGVNFDMQVHYRSNLNPVTRAKEVGGRGMHIIGHHELLVPLLWHLVESECLRRGVTPSPIRHNAT
ncbi:MAG: hypothetical protein GEEBNDBF_01415 [bacterium]|nr:hypothetical protein [bacterium]